jgi:citrate lyase subunit beta / citryl-CoA lyase
VSELSSGRNVSLIALIETARGLVEINACARAPLVTGLFLGAEDLTVDAGMERTSEGSEILYARSALVFASAAARISSTDSPFIDVSDDAGLRKDVAVTRRLGFTGKACVHPLQVQIVHEELAPSTSQIAWARRVIVADDEARARGIGAVALDGQMIDVPIVTRAKAILAKAARGGGHDA